MGGCKTGVIVKILQVVPVGFLIICRMKPFYPRAGSQNPHQLSTVIVSSSVRNVHGTVEFLSMFHLIEWHANLIKMDHKLHVTPNEIHHMD